jgi:hypothetical protein
MTVTLDGKTLDVKGLHEDFQVVNKQSDVWESGVYVRKVSIRGVIRTWQVQCVENAVVWVSSQAKSFQDTGTTGTKVTFAITDEVRVLSTSVYILGMTLDAQDLAGKNIRRFTVSLQEA